MLTMAVNERVLGLIYLHALEIVVVQDVSVHRDISEMIMKFVYFLQSVTVRADLSIVG